MKTIAIIKYLFTAIGLGMLAGAFFMYNSTLDSAFSEEMGAVLILAGMGSVFFLIGFSIIFFGIRKTKRINYLKNNGTRIVAKFQSVEINRSLEVNGRNPYKICAQWQNPSTSKLHIFESENIWFNPSNYITQENIDVLIERENPKNYYVDISFLPEVSR